jgi:phosphopantothenoylcysteine decarboxylase/phosphopantothenate--cysteine ligase
MMEGKVIVFGVCGGIAAYWSAEIVGQLKHMKAHVHVVMTKNATKFITPLTFQIISQNPVTVNMFAAHNPQECIHISLARKADFLLVAPATANIIGKAANGIADDALSTTIMATTAPVIFCPAMNDKMWANPIVQENVKKLKKCGYYFVEPEYGEMACGGSGVGRLARIESIINRLIKISKKKKRGTQWKNMM